MEKILAAVLALTIPGSAWAGALEDAGGQAGEETASIAQGVDQLHQDFSGKADADHLFAIIKDDKTKTTYLEIREQQLEHPFLISAEIDQGTAEGLLPATNLGTFQIVFHWNGDKIEVDRHSQTFSAEPGTPEAKAMSDSLPDSILAEIPMSSSDSVKQTIRFKADDLFKSDLCNLDGAIAKAGASQTLGSIDAADSSIKELTTYATNVEAQVRLVLMRPGNADHSLTPDARRYPIEVHYSLSEMRGDANFEKRDADGRVGYFTQTHVDYANKDLRERGLPIETIIERWNLQKTDPNAAVSDVKNPIVYWIDSSVPTDYRPAIKAGILAWNAAFEAIGMRNAIIVKDVDKDMTPDQRKAYDPSDASYNVVRWFLSPGTAFAEAKMRANPSTGEIFNGGIRISDGLLRAMTQEQLDHATGSDKTQADGAKGVSDLCDAFAEQAQLELNKGMAILDASGAAASEKTRFVNEFLTWMASHEMGHNLGLRHNFKGSEWLSDDQLGKDGYLLSSVMDYPAPNMKAANDPSQPYFQTKVGPYDMWAIKYGYGPKGQTSKTAAEANSNPALAYGTDEDVHTIWGDAVDPDDQLWDLGKGAMTNAQRHAKEAQVLWKTLPSAVEQTRDGNNGVSLKRRFVVGFQEYHAAVANLAPVIGGVHVSRGDPGAGNDSFTPVSAQEQHEALKFFEDQIFSDKNFAFDPSVIRKLGDEGSGDASVFNAPINVGTQVANLRADALRHLYAPAVLTRLDSRQEISSGDKIGLYDVMGELRHSIWSEIERPVPTSISSGRRLLQRMQLQILGELWQNEGGGDEREAALNDLTIISTNVKKALASGKLDGPTRAHLEGVQEELAQIKAPKAKFDADDIKAAMAASH